MRDPVKKIEASPAPLYTNTQLGHLQQISTSVDCECPNHLASILLALQGFERYSRDCENRNEEDASMHRMLFAETGRARVIMERALRELCAFEDIDVDALSTTMGAAVDALSTTMGAAVDSPQPSE